MPWVTGYEGVKNIEELTSGSIHQRDFTVPFDPCHSFDVVMCLEVAEHIPRAFEDVFLRNIACSARSGLILSWAPPGQFGTGHVNMRTRVEVLAKLGTLGFVEDQTASRFLGSQATFTWFKKNLLALHRSGQPSPFEPAVHTLSLESKPAVTGAGADGWTAPASLDAASVVQALDHLRAAYAKLEARLDELKLAKTDVLLSQALREYRVGLLALASVAKGSQS